jgi:hypothetical protein
LDKVNKDHDWKIQKMKEETEKMHREETTLRGLRARASAGIGGFAFFGDNVGKIVNPRYVHFKSFPTKECIVYTDLPTLSPKMQSHQFQRWPSDLAV